MAELSKTYSPQEVEDKIYHFWESHNLFHARVNPEKQPYTIAIPPPNITGILTMGHVLNNSLQDAFVRWKRMQGFEACWIPGTDHAGIATQHVVEKSLRKDGIERREIGREEFLKRVWSWKEQYGGTIIKQLRKLGTSCDWERERFTMDEGLSKAVQEVFIRLFEKGLVYRGKYIVNWCPKDHTALSDDEVNYVDSNGHLWYINYPVEGSASEFITVATTRPETMLGDTAIAVNPKDERYAHLVGKRVVVPLAERAIAVIADDYVDAAFGTGAVKVTPAHDPNDYQMGIRHNLEQMIVMDTSGKMNLNVPRKYQGMDRYECRRELLRDLDQTGLLLKTEDHANSVGHCYRCDTVIEPYLSDQWFVKMQPLAEPALKVVQDGAIKFYPERWTKVYEHWMTNIRDWCISRQLWWGHRIPAYYLPSGAIVVALTKEEALEKARVLDSSIGPNDLRQDEDVLDTWFSSWLWPFSILNWPEENEDLKYFYPTDTLVTGPDIIFFWVARMIMAGLEFRGEIPFRHVYFTSIIRDAQGRKMSKSLGNSPDPLDVIATYGADALRFTVLYLAPLGQDVMYSNEKCEMGRNFANKIWNAGRFLLMNKDSILGEFTTAGLSVPGASAPEAAVELSDRWIVSRFNATVKELSLSMDAFRINDAVKTIYDFLWHDFCDWYVEFAKNRIAASSDVNEKYAIITRALSIYEETLKLLHPFMPFITEEIWQGLSERGTDESIMVASLPQADETLIDTEMERSMEFLQNVISAVRTIRNEMNLPPSKSIDVVVNCTDDTRALVLTSNVTAIQKMTRAATVEAGVNLAKPGYSASSVVSGQEVFVPLKGLIDVDVERSRLEKEIARLQGQLRGVQAKLSNETFVAKAPADVLQKENDKLNNFSQTIAKLTASLEQLQG
ncbi:MAG TPA: valine--tRNA ligase [Bacteroidota bacterium]|nr:valine--tRNA ligase [Bacteroidota bacterium]